MKFFLLSFFLINFSFASFSQTQFTVTGKVVDKNTKAPLQAASVFAQNTTFGVATDAEGNFRLKLPSGGYDLIVTFTGYETESIRINSATGDDKDLVIEVKPREKEMQEVSVVASNEVADGMAKYGSFFFDNFIGKSEFSKQCTILNPEVLKFYFSKKRNRLKVMAAEPVQIKNDALGYIIKYSIDSFTYEYNTNTAFAVGYPLFEEMTGTADKAVTWIENRKRAYSGSLLHFMRSLYHDNLKSEGFELQYLVKNNDRETTIPIKNVAKALNFVRDDSLRTVKLKPNQPDLAVIYKNEKPEQIYLDEFDTNASKKIQVSLLNIVTNDGIVIEENGYFYEQTDVIFNGYWGFEKLGDMVPYDYNKQ